MRVNYCRAKGRVHRKFKCHRHTETSPTRDVAVEFPSCKLHVKKF